MQTMKWGLVPHWSKSEDKSLNTINARSENLVDGGGMWASIKGKNRCAIPCQGYAPNDSTFLLEFMGATTAITNG